MSYNLLFSTVVTILSAIITGGVILVFVEIGNRKNREIDSYQYFVEPFLRKLSAYFRFIRWCKNYIQFPDNKTSYESDFELLIADMSKYGDRIIMGGGDFLYGDFEVCTIKDILIKINNIWYFYDKMNPCKLKMDIENSIAAEYIQKELKNIDFDLSKEDLSIDLIPKVSDYFFSTIYQPIKYKLERHDCYMRQYAFQTWLVTLCVSCVFLVLCLLLFAPFSICCLKFVTVFAILILGFCLLVLGIDVKTQIKWKERIVLVYNVFLSVIKKNLRKYYKNSV